MNCWLNNKLKFIARITAKRNKGQTSASIFNNYPLYHRIRKILSLSLSFTSFACCSSLDSRLLFPSVIPFWFCKTKNEARYRLKASERAGWKSIKQAAWGHLFGEDWYFPRLCEMARDQACHIESWMEHEIRRGYVRA